MTCRRWRMAGAILRGRLLGQDEISDPYGDQGHSPPDRQLAPDYSSVNIQAAD